MVGMKWIKERNQKVVPVTFGVPWAKGTMTRDISLMMVGEDGLAIPAQAKTIGYWPDGSVKWTAISSVADTTQNYKIQAGQGPAPVEAITASVTENGVQVQGGMISCAIETGEMLVRGLVKKDAFPVSGKLVTLIENRVMEEDYEKAEVYRMEGVTQKVTLEEAGPIRVVVKVDGVHKDVTTGREGFPFTLRFYFFADSNEIKIVHTFIYDGKEEEDYLKGIALELYPEKTAEQDSWETGYVIEDDVFRAKGNNLCLSQDFCDHYAIMEGDHILKEGNRSQGTFFVGNEQGALAASVKDFWQKSPMALEVQEAVLTVWLWSRYTEAMDFRAYDTVTHIYSYGGILNHPQGIANTNEIYLKLYDAMPAQQDVMDFAADVQSETLMIAESMDVYGETKAFGGFWYTKDDKYKNPQYEKAIGSIQRFYAKEIDQRKWYGFWDYGDIMHTYDPTRHIWRYDVGGFAWTNTEFCPSYANWLVFLRTGDYDIYRYSRAMSRHCSEVDIYHTGKFASLGSRHNVRHWGCSSKEVRISMAGHFRYLYFLTADERIGDVMDEVKDSDFTTLIKDPMDIYFDPHPGYSHCRTGPDWTAFLSNWMTRWERTEDPKYRKKLLDSIESIKQAPLGLSSGSTFHYEPETGKMYYMGDPKYLGHTHQGDGNYQQHMVVMFGGAEVWFELCEWLEDEKFNEMVADFGEYYGMTPEERNVKSHGLFNETNDACWTNNCGRMTAYAGYYFDSDRYMETGWESLAPKDPKFADTSVVNMAIDDEGNMIRLDVPAIDSPYPLREVVNMTTNTSAQWSMSYMEVSHFAEQRGEK